MKHCGPCGVDFTGELDQCPLCQAKLTGTTEPAVFPRNEVKESGATALKVLAFATGVCLLVLVFLWQLLTWPGDIVATACLALIVNYLFVRNILAHSPDFLRVVVRYFLILLGIAAVWFALTQDLFITTFIIPGICFLALVFDAVLISVFRGTFVSGYAKYLLFNMVLGIAPIALVALGLTTWDVPAYISAFTSSVLFWGLIVFARKQLLAEIRKLFSA